MASLGFAGGLFFAEWLRNQGEPFVPCASVVEDGAPMVTDVDTGMPFSDAARLVRDTLCPDNNVQLAPGEGSNGRSRLR